MGARTQPHQPADEGDPKADASGLGWLPPPLLGEAWLGLPGAGAAGQFAGSSLRGRGPSLPTQVRGDIVGCQAGGCPMEGFGSSLGPCPGAALEPQSPLWVHEPCPFPCQGNRVPVQAALPGESQGAAPGAGGCHGGRTAGDGWQHDVAEGEGRDRVSLSGREMLGAGLLPRVHAKTRPVHGSRDWK